MMDTKSLYELIDTVYALMPDDAARQQFKVMVHELYSQAWDGRTLAASRWLTDHPEV